MSDSNLLNQRTTIEANPDGMRVDAFKHGLDPKTREPKRECMGTFASQAEAETEFPNSTAKARSTAAQFVQDLERWKRGDASGIGKRGRKQ